jgi:hypothetical protein
MSGICSIIYFDEFDLLHYDDSNSPGNENMDMNEGMSVVGYLTGLVIVAVGVLILSLKFDPVVDTIAIGLTYIYIQAYSNVVHSSYVYVCV